MKAVFLKKLAVLALLVALAQAAAVFVLGRARPPAAALSIEARLDADAHIVFFGDSTVSWASAEDQDPRFISHLLSEKLPHYSMALLHHPGYQPNLYRTCCGYIERNGLQPRILIVPINLYAFAPCWDLSPDTQFEEITFYLEHPSLVARAWYKPLAVFRGLSRYRLSQEEFDLLPVYWGAERIGRMRDFSAYPTARAPEELRMAWTRNRFILNAMYTLHPRHRQVRALRAIARCARRIGAQVLFYVTPLNYESGQRLLGEAFAQKLAGQVAVLEQALAAEGHELLDLSRTLGSDHFGWTLTPNGHLRQSGRQCVAQALYRALIEACGVGSFLDGL